MKPTKHILATIALLLCSIAASGHDFWVNDIYYNITSEEDLTVEVTFRGHHYPDYYEYAGAVTIPEIVTYNSNTYRVTSIGIYAFRECVSLTSISIPESVTWIGDAAFSDCSNLTSISIPESVTSIGGSAFDGTPWYNSLPDGVVYVNNVLYKYKGEMPDNTSIEVREGTVSISSYAFYECSSLTSITIPTSVTTIGDFAFSSCSSLISIVVAEGNTVYDSRNNCNAIIETSSNTLIAGCVSTVIPKSVTSIGDYAFYVCHSLTSITIPEGVTSIGRSAFSNCESLTSITLPASVTSIGHSAFLACNLTSINIPEDSRLTSIEDWTFRLCSSLTSITIPASVTSIGESAFSECSSLTSITIPENSQLTSIGRTAFYDCSNLTSITIPENSRLTSIGDWAFVRCTGLTTITIPASVTSIGNLAFSGCSSLASIAIPESVTSIGESAFSECSSLTSITSHAETPPTIGSSNAFYGVDKSIPVYVPVGSVHAYRTAKCWKEFANIIGIEAAIAHTYLPDSNHTPDAIYDLQGRKVNNPTGGIYIIGGKKTVIR